MTPEQQLLKDSGDLLREVVEILIGNNLEVVKKYSLIEERIKKQLGEPSGKPSLFDVKGNPAPDPVQPVATKTPTVQLAEQPPEFPEPPTEVITDPVKRVSKSFDGPFPPGDPRSTTPEQKKELTDPENHTGRPPLGDRDTTDRVRRTEPQNTITR